MTFAEPGLTDPYPGLGDDHLLHAAPSVRGSDGSTVVLADWLRKQAGEGVWAAAVAEMYSRAASVPMLADYFGGVDMPALQRHFVAAIVMVSGRGLDVGTVRRMGAAHAHIRNSQGQPITGEAFDAVIATLAGILTENGVPGPTVQQVGTLAGHFRPVIAVDAAPVA